jgi:hypothetical protein
MALGNMRLGVYRVLVISASKMERISPFAAPAQADEVGFRTA